MSDRRKRETIVISCRTDLETAESLQALADSLGLPVGTVGGVGLRIASRYFSESIKSTAEKLAAELKNGSSSS